MKNKILNKIVIPLVLMISTIFSLVGDVFALENVPSSITLTSSAAVKGYIGETINFGTKRLTNGTLAYCLDYHKQTTQNTTAKLVGEMDAGMAYLIENGYPNKSITGDNEKDYYITQTAIWWYLDETTSSKNLTEEFKTTDTDSANLREYIRKLKDEAINAKNKGYKNPKIAVSVSNNYLYPTADKSYYISDEIVVELTDLDNYSVSITNAPEGSYITDKTGNKKNTFEKGQTFRIYVPTSALDLNKKDIKISVSSTTKYNKVYKYSPESSEEQDIVPAIPYPTEVSVKTELNLLAASSIVKIDKIDASTKKSLKGAVLVIKDKAGNEILKFTTTDDTYIIKDLPNGEYTIEEVSAPDGYALSDKVYSFVVDNDNRSQSITVENYPAIKVPDTNSNSSIIMYIIGTLIIISGVLFTIYNAKKQK